MELPTGTVADDFVTWFWSKAAWTRERSEDYSESTRELKPGFARMYPIVR